MGRAAGGATTRQPSCESGRGSCPLLGRDRDLYAYFNNDWEAFAPANAANLRALLARPAHS